LTADALRNRIRKSGVRLDDCGFRKIEAGSLVSAYKVPQMAQTHELLNEANDIDAFLSVLVPTVHHFKKLPQNVDEIVLFVAVSSLIVLVSMLQGNIKCVATKEKYEDLGGFIAEQREQ
jgi:isopropylmalate/homocitrate/citramalate synthase